MESRSRVDRSPEDVRRCPLKEDKPFMSQLPPPPEEAVVSVTVAPVDVCLACGCERGVEELLKEYFQEGIVLACLLGLTTGSPFPVKGPIFGPVLGLGVWLGATAAHSLASRDEALLCSSWSVLGVGPVCRSSSDIQAPRLRCWS